MTATNNPEARAQPLPIEARQKKRFLHSSMSDVIRLDSLGSRDPAKFPLFRLTSGFIANLFPFSNLLLFEGKRE